MLSRMTRVACCRSLRRPCTATAHLRHASSGARHESAEELERRLDSTGGSNAVNSASDGSVVWTRHGVAGLTGLAHAPIGSVVQFEGGAVGMLCALDRHNVFAMLLSGGRVNESEAVTLTAPSLLIPVGPELIGRSLDGLGNCISGEPIDCSSIPLKMTPPSPPLGRGSVTRQLFTGIPALDMAAPVGIGQSLLIHGTEGSGKTSAARAVLGAQEGADASKVHCVYVAIGGDAKKRISALPTAIESFTTTVAAGSNVSDAQRMVAPYVGSTIASESAALGRDVVLIYDDLSAHAIASSSIAAALRTPAALAEPQHAALLHQAAANVPGGGSVTVIGLLQTAMSGDGTEKEPILLDAVDQSLSFSAPLWQQVWLARLSPVWQSATAGALGMRIKKGLIHLESLGSVAQVRRSIFGNNEDEPDSVAEHKALEHLAAMLAFNPRKGGIGNAEQAVAVITGLANLDSKGRLMENVDSRNVGMLQVRLVEHLATEHGDILKGLEQGLKLPGNAADEIFDVARQVIVKWLEDEKWK